MAQQPAPPPRPAANTPLAAAPAPPPAAGSPPTPLTGEPGVGVAAPAALAAPAPAAASTRRAVIQVQHVTKKFGDVVGVDDISFEVYEGEIFGFIGPSGSGKTTTMRLLNGIYAPTSGRCACWAWTRPSRPAACTRGSATCRSSSCSIPI